MFDFILFCAAKILQKSNNYQIFKEKSYYMVYYLTFLNRKIKILSPFYVLFIVLLLLYIVC